MIFIKILLMVFAAFGFGLLSSGGVFTVFVSVGLIPRFADKTHTAEKITCYENMVITGSITGCILSIFADQWRSFLLWLGLANWLNRDLFFLENITNGEVFLGIYGVFAGMFVGCFAIAIAEILNTIPIFMRRISLGRGTGIVLLGIALGKTIGSLLYCMMK